MYEVNTGDGRLRCKFKADGPSFYASPCVSDEIVYFGAEYYIYAVYALNCTLKWKYGIIGHTYSTPCISDSTLYIGSLDCNIYANNTVDGKLRWRYKTNDYIEGSSPCVSNGVAYIGSRDSCLYAIETYGYTGLKDTQSSSSLPSPSLSAFPNPFTNRLTLSLPTSGQVYSLTGQLIMQLDRGKHSLDTSKWREGVYVVKAGNKTKRVVKGN